MSIGQPFEMQPAVECTMRAEIEQQLRCGKRRNAFGAKVGPVLAGLLDTHICREPWVAEKTPMQIDDHAGLGVFIGP